MRDHVREFAHQHRHLPWPGASDDNPTPARDLYRAYERWCHANDVDPLPKDGNRSMGSALMALDYPWIGHYRSKYGMVWSGLNVRTRAARAGSDPDLAVWADYREDQEHPALLDMLEDMRAEAEAKRAEADQMEAEVARLSEVAGQGHAAYARINAEELARYVALERAHGPYSDELKAVYPRLGFDQSARVRERLLQWQSDHPEVAEAASALVGQRERIEALRSEGRNLWERWFALSQTVDPGW